MMTRLDQDEAALIRRAATGDDQAMACLFSPYQDRLFSYVYRWIGHWQTAEDLTQDILIKAMKALSRYRHRGHFTAWLFTIARRECFMHMRRAKVRQLYRKAILAAPEPHLHDLPSAACPLSQLAKEEQAAQLRACIDRLPAAERDVVLLRIYSELPFHEIATLLGCPLNTALTRMHKAQKRLKQMMESDHEYTATA